jgi:hypothetical protein
VPAAFHGLRWAAVGAAGGGVIDHLVVLTSVGGGVLSIVMGLDQDVPEERRGRG